MIMIRKRLTHSAATRMYKGYLIDLDGTMFNGDEVIDGAIDFIDRLNVSDIPYLFLTNNATRHPREILTKFERMGFKTEESRIYTSALAMRAYLEKEFNAPSIYLIGTDSFRETLTTGGQITASEAEVDAVVMGLDTGITYDKIITACRLIQQGALFLATNPDMKIKSAFGFSPGNGAFVKLISEVTGVAPTIIGKPNRYILDGALEKLNMDKSDVAVVGDNYDTDILTGINGGLDTIHVSTGVHLAEEVLTREIPPTHLIDTLYEWKL